MSEAAVHCYLGLVSILFTQERHAEAFFILHNRCDCPIDRSYHGTNFSLRAQSYCYPDSLISCNSGVGMIICHLRSAIRECVG